MFRANLKTKDDKSNYIFYSGDSENVLKNILEQDQVQTMSIDIGVKNFACRIERRYKNGNIIPIYFGKIDFRDDDVSNTTKVNPKILNNVYNFFCDHWNLLYECQIIGIERQLAINYKATRIFQHVLTILTLFKDINQFYNENVIIFDINSKFKGKILNAPKEVNIKTWSVEKAIELLYNL